MKKMLAIMGLICIFWGNAGAAHAVVFAFQDFRVHSANGNIDPDRKDVGVPLENSGGEWTTGEFEDADSRNFKMAGGPLSAADIRWLRENHLVAPYSGTEAEAATVPESIRALVFGLGIFCLAVMLRKTLKAGRVFIGFGDRPARENENGVSPSDSNPFLTVADPFWQVIRATGQSGACLEIMDRQAGLPSTISCIKLEYSAYGSSSVDGMDSLL